MVLDWLLGKKSGKAITSKDKKARFVLQIEKLIRDATKELADEKRAKELQELKIKLIAKFEQLFQKLSGILENNAKLGEVVVDTELMKSKLESARAGIITTGFNDAKNLRKIPEELKAAKKQGEKVMGELEELKKKSLSEKHILDLMDKVQRTIADIDEQQSDLLLEAMGVTTEGMAEIDAEVDEILAQM